MQEGEEESQRELLEQTVESLREELDTFSVTSREVEEELEKSLKEADSRADRAERKVLALEALLEKQAANSKQLAAKEEELQLSTQRLSGLQGKLQELEDQTDQSSERERRAIAETEQLRQQLDETLEIKTLTETDLQDAQTLAERARQQVQELQDEIVALTPTKPKKQPAQARATPDRRAPYSDGQEATTIVTPTLDSVAAAEAGVVGGGSEAPEEEDEVSRLKAYLREERLRRLALEKQLQQAEKRLQLRPSSATHKGGPKYEVDPVCCIPS